MKQRIYWIDNLKGFILLMVCFFHFGILCPFSIITGREGLLTFFFLSGYLFCDNKYATVKTYIKSKFQSLLLPYFTLSFLLAFFPFSLKTDFIFASEWIHTLNLPINIELYINTYIINTIDIIQGYSFQDGTTPLWFVYTLFQVSIIYYIINKIPYQHIKFTLIIGSLFIGWYCNIYSIVLPFHLNTMFISLFFYGLGHNSHMIIEKGNKIYYMIFFLVIFIFSYINGGFYDLRINELGPSLFIFLLYTTSGIAFFIILFKYISKNDNIVFGIFRNISRNALIILSMHFFFAALFDSLFQANYYFKLLFILICTIISIPIFRCYLYKLIGKEKISIKESLSIK